MTGMSNLTAKRVLDYVFGNVTPPSVGDVYFALLTQEPTGSGPLPNSEIADPDYSRVALENDPANWTAAPLGIKYKYANPPADYIAFPYASEDWPPVVSVAVMDAVTDGEMLFSIPVSPPLSVKAGGSFRIYPGARGFKFTLH